VLGVLHRTILGVLGGFAALGVSSAFIGARALYVHLELAHDQAAVNAFAAALRESVTNP
jgi:hypothetical protein